MIFSFIGISKEEEKALGEALQQSKSHLAAEDWVKVYPKEEYLLFEYASGYSFYRSTESETATETFRRYLQDFVILRYMPLVYELTGKTSEERRTAAEKLLDNFNKFSKTASAHIDWLLLEEKHLVLMLVPQEIIVKMMRLQGGALFTEVTGPAEALRSVPSMKALIPDSAADREVLRRMFATKYAENQYHIALAYHNQLLREVVANPGKGITIYAVPQWNP